jgi:hypothetical protein
LRYTCLIHFSSSPVKEDHVFDYTAEQVNHCKQKQGNRRMDNDDRESDNDRNQNPKRFSLAEIEFFRAVVSMCLP